MYVSITSTGRKTEMGYEDPNISNYLSNIGKIPLLTGSDEQELAKKIIAGNEATEKLENDEGLSTLERRKLIRTEQEGKAATKRFIESNLRLVVSIARRYNADGMTLLDLVPEGNIGLMRAVEKFDYKQGTKFSTYATWWIRQSIQRGINDKARTIRIPEDVVKEYGRIFRAESEIVAQGKDPEKEIEEIATKLKTTAARIREVKEFFQGMTSLDTPVGEDGDTNFGDFVESTNIDTPEQSLDDDSLSEQVNLMIDSLSERSKQIIRLRFGFVDNRIWTLEEIGNEFNITRERVRQIEAKAIKKLQEAGYQELLRDYL